VSSKQITVSNTNLSLSILSRFEGSSSLWITCFRI